MTTEETVEQNTLFEVIRGAAEIGRLAKLCGLTKKDVRAVMDFITTTALRIQATNDANHRAV